MLGDVNGDGNFERMRRQRLKRTQKAMAKYGIAAVVSFNPDNYRYMTGIQMERFSISEFLRYTICPVEGKPIHWELGGDYGRVHEEAKEWGQEVRVCLPISPTIHSGGEKGKREALKFWIDNIKMVLKDNGLGNGKVAVDTLTLPLIEALQEAGIAFTDATMPLQDARVIKTQDELQCLRIACAIADAGHYTLEQSIRPGIRECELWGEMAKTMFSLGAETFLGLLNSGGRTNPYYRLQGSDRIVVPGDIVNADICIQYMGYHTCVVRSYVAGRKFTSEQKALYRECYDALYKAINVCKAGVTTDKVAEALPKQTWENLTLQIGHGLGLALHEKPWITWPYSQYNPIKLEPGMYLAIETYAGEPVGSKDQGVRLEENFVITEDGYEIFSKYPFDDERLVD